MLDNRRINASAYIPFGTVIREWTTKHTWHALFSPSGRAYSHDVTNKVAR